MLEENNDRLLMKLKRLGLTNDNKCSWTIVTVIWSNAKIAKHLSFLSQEILGHFFFMSSIYAV